MSPDSSPTTKPLTGRRCAVVVYSYFPDDPRPAREARALVDAGMEVDYICLRENADQPRHETTHGIKVTRMPMKRRRRGRLTYMAQYLGFLIYAFGLVSFRSLRRPYDLVHVHNMPDVLVFSALIARWRGARVLLDLHDPMPELMEGIFGLGAGHWLVRLLLHLERWSLAFAHHAVTPNQAFRDLFVARSCPAAKMSIVMNTPDESIFDPAAPAPPRAHSDGAGFELMYHGSLVERHGLDTALEAVARLRPSMPDLHFSIYGHATEYLDTILADIETLGLQNAVTYQGARDLPGIAAAIAGCDLGLVPNHRTTFTEINMPTRLFEYLAMGKPMIAPSTRGICDYFDPDAMVYFEPGDAEDLARRIAWIREHPQEVVDIVGRGQAVHRDHSWSRERQILLDLVSNLVSRL